MYADATGPFAGAAMQRQPMLGAQPPQSNSLADDLLTRLAGQRGAATQEGSGFWGITSADVQAAAAAMSARRGDRVAIDGSGSTTLDDKTAIPLNAITYLKPGDAAALKDPANTATAAQFVGARARVQLAEQNAPAVIAATGEYPDEQPTAQDFVNIYGAEEGSKRFDQFRTTAGVAKSFFDMYRAPNQAIHAELRDFEPGPNGSPEERERYEIRAGAAQLILGARDADPVAYISQIFPGEAPDWSKVSTPQDFQAAITWARAAQQQMGFGRVLAVPQALSDSLGARYVDESVPLQQRIIDLSEVLKAVRDPKARFVLAGQVFQSALDRLRQNAANNPKITPAELEAQGKVLEASLIEMAQHPARVRFNAGSWWQKPIAAVNDSVRLVANGATFDQADKFAAGMNWLFSDKSYDELLAAEQAESEDAEDRAGSAGSAAKLLGAFATGHALTFTGKFGAEALEGLPGLVARSAGMAADGAVFGGVDAALNGRDILRDIGTGALLGAGGNVLAEGLGAIGRQVLARLAERSADAKISTRRDAEMLPAGQASHDGYVPGAGEIPGHRQGVDEVTADAGTTGDIADGHVLHLVYMPHWTAIQRAAADLKVAALNQVDKIVSPSVRAKTSASTTYKRAGNEVPTGNDVDHVHDLQLGGSEGISNMAILDRSVNRSLGPQIHHRIKHLPHGTRITKITIGDR
ncbi:hypothetical protein EB235_17060 [Mesorhizobium loti R88b]|uniref:Uncharacterized protein n=2 Tax=Rhizobium loti TaxID=381 RepID=A0A6M7WVH3_RHILI|nr:hypothetical protein EB235_17060 [Mesorhizobium loti R88b]